MAVTDDLRMIALQERELVFPKFDEADAWQLGCSIREWGCRNKKPIAIDVRTFNRPLFFTALTGSTPENIDWIRRKSNIVDHYRRSSYAVGLELIAKGLKFEDRSALSLRDYAPYGGSFPILLDKYGIVGAATVSGLDQRDDHMLVVTTISEILGLDSKRYVLTEKAV